MPSDELKRDTIAAIATPSGRGGIGVVRVSGPLVAAIAREILGALPQPRHATHSVFKDLRGDALGVLLAPYDLREMTMLGDAGSNALGAMLGLESVGRLTGLRRTSAIGALAAVTLLGERRSLGSLIETTSGLRALDALGRYP